MKAKTKSILTVCLALALMASAILGTIAYMTASSKKTNAFTVGKFDKPTTNPDSGDQLKKDLDGYILENKWDPEEEHKLVPGGEIDKDPQIGIGKGSEDAYVYAFVENPMVYNGDSEDAKVIRDGSVYFELNQNWQFVEVKDDKYSYKKLTVDSKDYYTGGLFKYVGPTDGVLSATSEADAWTGTIFDKVITGKDVNTADWAKTSESYNIVVSAFIHQAKDGKDGSTLSNVAAEAADAWAKKIVNPDVGP